MRWSVFFQSLTIILSPLYILRGDFNLHFLLFNNISEIPFTFLEVLILMTALITFIEYFKEKGSLKNLKTGFNILILLFIFSAAFSLQFSYDLTGGLGILKAYFIEPVLFFYSLVITAKRRNSYQYIINSLIIAGVWLSALGLLQKLTHSFSLAPHEIVLDRISGVYNSANSLALFLGPVALITLTKLLSLQNLKSRIFYLFLFIFFVISIIWTRSRGGMLAELLSITIFLYALLAYKNKLIKKYWYVMPLIGFIVGGWLIFSLLRNYNFFPNFDGKPYSAGDTLQIRFFIWMGTRNMLEDHFITGAGLNGFKTLYSNEYRLPQYQEQFQYPHNLFLTFWTETGLYGLLTFLAIVVGSYGFLIRGLVKAKSPVLGAGLIAVLSYWMLHGVVDVPYFKNDLSLQFWTVIALVEVWREVGIKGQVSRVT